MLLSSSSFDLAVFVQLIYWERSCQPRRGGGGRDIFLIKPLQPALLILYCTTNLCPKKITLLFGYNASVCLAQSSTVQLRLIVIKLVHFARWFLRWLYCEGFYLLLYKVFTLYFALVDTLYCAASWGLVWRVNWQRHSEGPPHSHLACRCNCLRVIILNHSCRHYPSHSSHLCNNRHLCQLFLSSSWSSLASL